MALEEGGNGAAAGEAAAREGAEGRGAGAVLLGAEEVRKVRVVVLKKADVKSLAAVLRASRKMPQLRFFLLLDDLNVRVRN